MSRVSVSVIRPLSPGTMCSWAPSAFMWSSFSRANTSDVTMRKGCPFTAHTSASETPVLPPVYSTTDPAAARRPSASPASIMASAIRSFMLPVGFSDSSFSRIRDPFPAVTVRNRTSPVFPIRSSTFSVMTRCSNRRRTDSSSGLEPPIYHAEVNGYGQFCAVARALEVLDERWTLLVVRELMLGASSFTDIRRGLPRIPRATLSARLRTLRAAGVVDEDYRLTEAGVALAPVVRELARWAVITDSATLTEDDLDTAALTWDMQRRV